jgi:hypothetical protein
MLVLALAALAVIAAAVLAASGSLDPKLRLVSLTEEGVHEGPFPARPGEDSQCARHSRCVVKALFENLGAGPAVVAVFTAHTYTATETQGNFHPAGPDAQCSAAVPSSTKGQSVEVSCTLQAPPGILGGLLDSPVMVTLR